MEKLNEVFFGNVSRKISFLTKLIMIIELVVGIILIVTGIVKYHFFTYISYGLGMTDLSVRTGATYMLTGLCVAIGGWLVGLVILGLNKLIQRAEFEEALEKEYWKNFECAECEARDGSCVEVVVEETAKTAAKATTKTDTKTAAKKPAAKTTTKTAAKKPAAKKTTTKTVAKTPAAKTTAKKTTTKTAAKKTTAKK